MAANSPFVFLTVTRLSRPTRMAPTAVGGEFDRVDDGLAGRIGEDKPPHWVRIGNSIVVAVARVSDSVPVEVDIPVLADECHSGLKDETPPLGRGWLLESFAVSV